MEATAAVMPPNIGEKMRRYRRSLIPMPPGSGSISTDIDTMDCRRVMVMAFSALFPSAM